MTVFSGAESLLNSRPHTYQSSDVRDIVPLTPNHFLYGQAGGQLAPEAVEATGFHPKQRWRKLQHLISFVWRRWMKEYLPTLIPCSKWLKVQLQGDLQVGDIVLVCQSDLPRGHWPLGRIFEVYAGKDRHKRVAQVQLAEKTLMRPIHKLVPLNVV